MTLRSSTILLVLASGSAARASMLESAGLRFTRDPPDVDEAAIKRARSREAPESVAEALAMAKAAAVAQRHPGALVIGADQMLECDGRLFDKPPDTAAAREQLLALRGRTHRLITAAALLQDGEPVWRRTEIASLTMREFGTPFLDEYLETVGDRALSSVGAYQLEGPGAQLFQRVDGDFFTILGLPLLPLLEALRNVGVLRT